MRTAKTYHHGDLRAALLSAARARLTSDGYETLSLRALARDIGVASSAPYAHFSSREELLWALIDEAARDLGAMFGAIATAAGAPVDRLATAGRAYLAFAKAEPELMRLIYVSPLTTERVFPADAARSVEIFEALVAAVLALQNEAQVREVAIGCWSVLHGFAMLRLHNRLAPDIDAELAAEQVVAASVRLARTALEPVTAPPEPP